MYEEHQHYIETVDQLTEGMSDAELEILAGPAVGCENGLAPWATWESENSSFGRTIRDWTGYSNMLPIFLCSDHGVNPHSRIRRNERENKYKTYLTWNAQKYKSLKKESNITPIFVQHPWVNYRRTRYPRRTLETASRVSGTLVFFPHSNPQSELIFDYDAFFSDLAALPQKFHPIVLCIMSHDIKKGLHKALRRYGFPIITAGNTNSQFFVDRFYKITFAYKYVATVDMGSHVFYCLEAGLPVFFTGDKVERRVTKDWGEYKKGDELGTHRFCESDQRRLNEVMEKLDTPSTVGVCATQDQIALAEHYMGVHAKTSAKQLKKILWAALLRNKREGFRFWLRACIKRLKSI